MVVLTYSFSIIRGNILLYHNDMSDKNVFFRGFVGDFGWMGPGGCWDYAGAFISAEKWP